MLMSCGTFLHHISIVAELRLDGTVTAVPESQSYTRVDHAPDLQETVIEPIIYR